MIEEKQYFKPTGIIPVLEFSFSRKPAFLHCGHRRARYTDRGLKKMLPVF